jgi:hypothetical protein
MLTLNKMNMKRLLLLQLLILTAIAVCSQNRTSSNYLKVLPRDQQVLYWQRNDELKYASLSNVVEQLNGKDCFMIYPDNQRYWENGQFCVSVYMNPHISNNYIVLKHYKRVYHYVFLGQSWVEYFPMDGYVKISLDGKRIILPNGVEYNKPISKDKMLSIDRQSHGSAGIYGGNGSSSSSSSGGNYNNSTTDNRCKTCGGSGVCSSCHGRGGSWQYTGYYVGDDSKSWISCPSCNGSGRCFMCHGSGRF